jgi:site-specific DNA recombinase
MGTRAIGYIRVSTEKQAEHGLSLEAQRAKLVAYAALYDLALIGVEVDVGESAKSLQRPGLQRALKAMKSGQADAVVVVKLDRLTRSVTDLGALIAGYFQKYSLMSVSEQIDTRSAAGRMVLNILASVSQWEREAIGERTQAAMQYKQAQHEYCGGEPPYGWQVTADGVHLEPQGEEQAIMRQARALQAAGLSLRKIGARLQAQGLLPRKAPAWHAKTINALLQAEVA